MKLETIQAFCEADDGHGRYAMNSPWMFDGFIYATDRHRCIRVKDDSIIIPKVEGRRPDVADVLAKNPPPETGWKPLFYKPHCDCKPGKSIERCDTCGGIGEEECNLGHTHPCGECEGTGKVEVETDCECKDEIDGYLYRRRLLAPLHELPGCEYVVVPDSISSKLHFRGDGYYGIVMGLSK